MKSSTHPSQTVIGWQGFTLEESRHMAEYNGWSNYETWNVALWLDNDECSYNYWQERTKEIAEESEPEYDWETKEDAARNTLADEIKSIVEDQSPLASDASLYSDLLGAALSEVDWHEIAEHYLDDVEVEVETDS